MRAELPAVRLRPAGQLALVALRLVLAGGLLVGWANLLARPQHTTIEQLLRDVGDGRTAAVTIERPSEGLGGSNLDVHWSTGFWQRWATSYDVRRGSDDFAIAGNDVLDQLRQAAASAPRPVGIRIVPQNVSRSYTNWTALFVLLTLVLLIAGPDPTIATRWAWFWLGTAVPLSFAVFLAAEPWFTRDRVARAGARRLTGGRAFLLGLVIAAIAAALLPRFRDVLFTSRAVPAR